MKLRASLERKESRGTNYRADYPYRNDEEYLCYLAITKGDDGAMTVDKIPVKDEWTGDRSEEYATRYGVRFPGEAKAKGLPEEESSGSWKK